jgi:transcriptional regulator with XRE-family HTH domain
MSNAVYSAENRILGRMQALGLTADHLATLDGSISPSRLSAAFRGVKNLENPTAERLLRLLDELDELTSSLSPIPISWKATAAIKTLLAAKRSQQLEIRIELGAAAA